jgi:hypothetical protein
LAIFDKSANLVESLADDDCEENERNAIVARIARMTITTISSTRVKAEYELEYELFFVLNMQKILNNNILRL